MYQRLKSVAIVALGISSLAVIGVIGLIRWKWMRKGRQTEAVESQAADNESTWEGIRESQSSLDSQPNLITDCSVTQKSATPPRPAKQDARVEPLETARANPNGDLQFTASCEPKTSNIETCSSTASIEDDARLSCSLVPDAGPPCSESSGVQGVSRADSGALSRVQVVVNIPKHLVGRFIGRQGRNVRSLRTESGGAYIYVDQVVSSKFVPCYVHGDHAQVKKALKLISYKYPNISIPPCPFEDLTVASAADASSSTREGRSCCNMELQAAGIPASPFQAMVTYIESLRRVWLLPVSAAQLLEELHNSMRTSYTSCASQPMMEAYEFAAGSYCAVGVDDTSWLRGIVLKVSTDGQSCDVQLVDYGSHIIVATSMLRPMRPEHTQLQLHAFACLLANIQSTQDGPSEEEAMTVLQALVENNVLEVHLVGLETDGQTGDQLPLIELYAQYNSWTPTFVNRELVDQGFAIWMERTS